MKYMLYVYKGNILVKILDVSDEIYSTCIHMKLMIMNYLDVRHEIHDVRDEIHLYVHAMYIQMKYMLCAYK